MDQRDRQRTNRGFGDAMSRSFELAITPLLFGGLGWLLDRVFGTAPMFTIALAVFGVVGSVLKLWIGYDREMKRHEDEGIWNRPSLAVDPSPSAETAP